MKLTKKQKEVIEAMRAGNHFSVSGCAGVVLTWTKQCELVNAGIVKRINAFNYELTDLGKSITL